MARFSSHARRTHSSAGLVNAADAAGYAIAGFEETRIEASLRQRFGRWIYVLIFAPLALAIGSLVMVGMAI